MPIPDWVKSEDWDILRLGGARVPGIAKVKAKIDSNLDIKKPCGGKKASIKDNGDPLVELEVELDMSHADVVAFGNMSHSFRPVTKGGARNPLKCEHPEAALWGIYNVVVADIESDHPESGGRKKITIKLVEWAPGPVAVKAAAKKPDDDAGGWAGYEDDVAGSGAPPPPRPVPILQQAPIRKPSGAAGRHI